MTWISHLQKKTIQFIFIILLFVTFSCEQKKGDASPAGGQPQSNLVSINVEPANDTTPVGVWQQMTAIGIYADNSNQDLTGSVVWSSSDPGVVNIGSTGDNRGRAIPTYVGKVTLTASLGNVSGSTTLTVTDAVLSSISVTPNNASVSIGMQQQFRATAIYSDNSKEDVTVEVNWSSAQSAVASIANGSTSKGLAAAKGVGETQISAQFGSMSGSANFKVTAAELVSLEMKPKIVSVLSGVEQQMTVIGTYGDKSSFDLTNSATWSSTRPSIASVSNTQGAKGTVTAKTYGDAVISARVKNLLATGTVTVVDKAVTSIDVTPKDATAFLGMAQQFSAMGTFSDGSTSDVTKEVTWTSDRSVIAIGNSFGQEGLGIPQKVGSSFVNAGLGAVLGNTNVTVENVPITSISISPQNVTIPLGLKQAFTAQAQYANGKKIDITKTATWSSSDESVATISSATDSSGMATSLKAGSTQISASFDETTSSFAALIVTEKKLISIDVTPHEPTISISQTVTLSATGTYSDGTTAPLTEGVTWGSSSPVTASVDSAGVVTGKALGRPAITATVGSVKGQTLVRILSGYLVRVAVNPNTQDIPSGTGIQFQAIGIYSDGSNQDITLSASWSSSDSNIATVGTSETGGIPGWVVGKQRASTATITATYSDFKDNPIQGNATVNILDPLLTSIEITPADPVTLTHDVSVYSFTLTQQFNVTGHYTDGSIRSSIPNFQWIVKRTAHITDCPYDVNTAKMNDNNVFSFIWAGPPLGCAFDPETDVFDVFGQVDTNNRHFKSNVSNVTVKVNQF